AWLLLRARMIAMSNVLPLSAWCQSCGTWIVAQSNFHPDTGCRSSCWATSGQGVQEAVPAAALPPLAAPGAGSSEVDGTVPAPDVQAPSASAVTPAKKTIKRRLIDPTAPIRS